MRIRRIPLALIKPGALVDGKMLIDADLAYQIDNMEGIAVHRNAHGETIITLVSDDNFSAHPAQSAAAIRAGGRLKRKCPALAPGMTSFE